MAGLFAFWPRPALAQDETFERWVATWGSDDKQCIRSTIPPDPDVEDSVTTYDYSEVCRTITRALAVAKPGDVIRVAMGTYVESFTIGKSVTIIGGYPPFFGLQIEPPNNPITYPVTIFGGTVTIRGQSLTILDPSITGEPPMEVLVKGVNVSFGGGISIFSGGSGVFPFTASNRVKVTLENVNVQNNSGGSNGGGIDISGADNSLEIVKGVISGNSTSGRGGGVYVGSGALLKMENGTLLHGNQAAGNGGGIAAYYALTSTVTGGITLTANSAASGGGIAIESSRLNVGSDTFVKNNSATTSGGGIYLAGGTPTVSSVVVQSNQAASGGGGIYVANGTPVLENLTVALNSAPNGGGVYLASVVKGELRGGSILTNTATTGAGGGFYVNAGTAVSVTSNTLQGNLAQVHGGGGYVTGASSVLVAGNTFNGNDGDKNNDNSGDGGGLYVTSLGGSGAFSGNSYAGNNAYRGGGLYVNAGGSARFADEVMATNQAVASGGGVYLTGSSGTLFDGLTLSENAAASGGGLYATGNGTVDINMPNLLANTSSGDGAGLYAVSSTLVVTGSALFQDNIAGGNGGGVYVGSNGNITFQTLDMLTNEAVNGGGLYSGGGRVSVYQAGSYLGNLATGSGGALYYAPVGGVAGQLINTYAQGNEAVAGAAIYASGVTLQMGKVDIQANEAKGGSGGGIALDTVTLTVTDTAKFVGNIAGVHGGGVMAENSAITFQKGVSFLGNRTQGGDGGGLYANASSALDVDLKTATVQENVAAGSGGGVYAAGANLLVSANSSFYRNIAQAGNGGGLAVSGRPLSLTRVKLEENNAMLLGGGGYLNGATGSLTSVTVRANESAGGSGGGFAVANVSSFTVISTTFLNNKSNKDGAGFHANGSTVTLQNGTSFSSNTAAADGRGGALFATGGSTTITGITLSSNQAGSGGGALYLTGAGAANLSNNTLSQNNGGTGPGGGMYLQLASATLSANVVQQNQAATGGGVYLENTTRANATGGAVVDNTATGAGGGIYATGSTLSLNNGGLRGNQAGGEGGGVYLIYSRMAVTNTVLVRNRLVLSTTYGAGIYAANAIVQAVHLTLADNSHLSTQGIPHGIYAPPPVTPPGGAPAATSVSLVNTIVSGQAVGVNLLAGNSATFNTVLWNNTRFDWTGAAAFAVANSKRGDPSFVAPLSGDYRLKRNSAAFDQGITTAVLADRDGNARPQSLAPDLGAHEQRYSAGLYLTADSSPTFVKLGDTVTMNVRVRNQSTQAATNVNLTIVLPAQMPTPSISQGSCQGNFCTVALGTLTVGADVTVQVSAAVGGTPSATGLVSLQTNISLVAGNFTATDTSASLRALLHSCLAERGGTVYTTVQAAVDAASAGETIRVSGTCGDFHQSGGPGQLLTLGKNVTLQGGWNSTFTVYNPTTFPSALDAGGRGRVVYLPAGVTPTLQTIVLRGGSAAGLGGGPAGKDAGGGLYIDGSTPVLLGVDISGNSSPDVGGGVYLANAAPTFSGGFIRSNTAGERGGGIYVDQVAPTFSGVTISGNSARSGGGAYLANAAAQFLDTAATGGTPTCKIDLNTTSGSPAYNLGPGAGGLPVLWLAPGGGGGLFLDGSAAVIRGCSVNGNSARAGGGIYIHNSAATLENSLLTSNRAQSSVPVLLGPGGTRDGDGGGLLIDNTDPAGLVMRGLLLGLNTGTRGAAMLTRLGRSGTLALPHMTINTNSGGAAVVALGQSALAFNDTIAAFNTGGAAMFAQNGANGEAASITLERTLWHPNTQTRTGTAAGGSVTASTDFTGDPAFRNDGYHLKRISFAYGVGATAANFADRDGNTRPVGANAELGADEYASGVTVRYVAVGGAGAAPCTDYRSPCGSLQTALDAASDGDLIKMTGGTYSGVTSNGGTVQYARIAKSVTIQGGYFARTDDNTVTDRLYTVNDWEDPHPVENPTVIDVARQGRIFYITGPVTPTLAYLTLRGGSATGLGGSPDGATGGAGGAVYVDGAAPVFANIGIEESSADFGSAFYLKEADGIFAGLTVSGNGADVAAGQGGAFYVEGGAPVLVDLTVQSNVAVTGAGIYLDHSDATLVQSTIADNGGDATLDGGGIYIVGGAPTVITNTVTSNRSRRGGGVRVDDSAALLRGNTISANQAGANPAPAGQNDAYGAGLYLMGGQPRIVENQFVNNVAAHPTLAYGGGLYLGQSAAAITGNTWSGNRAHRGAGLYAAGTTTATVTLNTFTGNTADAPNSNLRPAGGAIFLAGTTITVSHNSLVQNSARFGGGIYMLGGGGVIYSNTVTANQATQDGGGLYLDGSTVQVHENVIQSNRTVQGNGGGLLARRGQAEIADNTLLANQATLGGGGVYLDDDGSFVTRLRIQGNTSADGAGMYVSGPEPGAAAPAPQIEAVLLYSNTAGNNAGGLYVTTSGLSFQRGIIRGNQAAVNGGGVYLVDALPTDFAGNVIAGNSAAGKGGGVMVGRGTTGLYASNAVVDNQAQRGGGILVEGAQPVFVHTTLARNGTGLVVIPGGDLDASVILTNTVFAGHALAAQAETDAALALYKTLWDGNSSNIAGPGTVTTAADISGAAQFAADGYHLTATSAAISRGLLGDFATGADLDGDARFQGQGPDLGADEFNASCAAILAGIPANVYTDLQQAVDAAPNNGEVRVAGTCTGVASRGGGTQLLYIDKNVTVRGGYSTSDWNTSTPSTRPTVLDARAQGRGVRIATGRTVTLVGLTLINGTAAGQGGGPSGADAGGAFYADGAQITLNGLTIMNSRAAVGGGAYLAATTSLISSSTFRGNVAAREGGALYVANAPLSVEVRSNQFFKNRGRDGGALYVAGGNPLVQGNEFRGNQAEGTSGLEASGRGGAVYLANTAAKVNRNRIEGNRAVVGAAVYVAGGLPDPTNNLVVKNVATQEAGAIYSVDTTIHLRNNTFTGNSTLRTGGSAILFAQPTGVSTPVSMTNNIVVNHTLAISVAVNSPLNLRANLWFNNGTNYAGPGTVTAGADNVTVDPGFANPDADNYLLKKTSAAIDRGINIGVFDDRLGQPRPAGQGFDIGSDEYLEPVLNATLVALPDPVASGGQVAYRVQVLNIGDLGLVMAVRLTLPDQVTPLGPVEWIDVPIARGAVWTEVVAATVDADYTGPLVATVQVTSDEGATANAQVTSEAAEISGQILQFSGESAPDPVEPGSVVELRLRLTNAGGIPLQTRIEATLPPGLKTTSPTVFTPTINGPDGAWASAITAVVADNLRAGFTQLVTTIVVTSDQGIDGSFAITTEIARAGVAVSRVVSPRPAVAGRTLAYAVTVTNTGNTDLQTTISNTFPAQVAVNTLADAQLWQVDLGPGEVYKRIISATVEAGYTGQLVGAVRVDTDQGVSASAVDKVAAAPAVLVPTAVAKGGDWYAPSSWEPPVVPSAADIVSIPTGVTLYTTRPIVVAGLVNNGTLELRSLEATATQVLTVTGTLENYGEIRGANAAKTNQPGVSVEIYAGTLFNDGLIGGGDGAVEGGDGGNLILFAGATTNEGILRGGNGADVTDPTLILPGGDGGDVFLTFVPGLFTNRGQVLGGDGGDSYPDAIPPQPGGSGGDVTLMATAAARLANSDVMGGSGGAGSTGAEPGTTGNVVVGAPEIQTQGTRFGKSQVTLIRAGSTDVSFTALAPILVFVSADTGVANFNIRIFNSSAIPDAYIATPQATPTGWVVNNLPATLSLQAFRTNTLPVALTVPVQSVDAAANQPFAVVITSQRNAGVQVILPITILVVEDGNYHLRLPSVQQ